jgi:Rod binding domain-containing protein
MAVSGQGGMAAPLAGAAQVVNAAQGPGGGNGRLRVAADEYEAVFLSQMLETMTSGIKTDGPFSGGPAEGIYRSMLNQEYGKAIGKAGGIGIADAVYREMLRIQETHS